MIYVKIYFVEILKEFLRCCKSQDTLTVSQNFHKYELFVKGEEVNDGNVV